MHLNRAASLGSGGPPPTAVVAVWCARSDMFAVMRADHSGEPSRTFYLAIDSIVLGPMWAADLAHISRLYFSSFCAR